MIQLHCRGRQCAGGGTATVARRRRWMTFLLFAETPPLTRFDTLFSSWVALKEQLLFFTQLLCILHCSTSEQPCYWLSAPTLWSIRGWLHRDRQVCSNRGAWGRQARGRGFIRAATSQLVESQQLLIHWLMGGGGRVRPHHWVSPQIYFTKNKISIPTFCLRTSELPCWRTPSGGVWNCWPPLIGSVCVSRVCALSAATSL